MASVVVSHRWTPSTTHKQVGTTITPLCLLVLAWKTHPLTAWCSRHSDEFHIDGRHPLWQDDSRILSAATEAGTCGCRLPALWRHHQLLACRRRVGAPSQHLSPASYRAPHRRISDSTGRLAFRIQLPWWFTALYYYSNRGPNTRPWPASRPDHHLLARPAQARAHARKVNSC